MDEERLEGDETVKTKHQLGSPTPSLQELLDLRALLYAKERWTQGTFAKDAEGHPIWSQNPKAHCWCLLGAIHKVCPESSIGPMSDYIRSVLKLGNDSLATWNDAASHIEVKIMLNIAVDLHPDFPGWDKCPPTRFSEVESQLASGQ